MKNYGRMLLPAGYKWPTPSLILCDSALANFVTTGLIFLQFMQMKELLYLAIAMMADDLNAAFIESHSL